VSQDNFDENQYTFWKVRVAENAIDFWVERGNFTYNVTLERGQKID